MNNAIPKPHDLLGRMMPFLLLLGLESRALAAEPVRIELQPDQRHQEIVGIGGNFCQGDQVALVKSGLYDAVFAGSGLNLSFIRIAQAVDVDEPEFLGYDAANVQVIKEFRRRQPFGKVMLTTWSPPASLKSTHSAYRGTLAQKDGQFVYAEYGAWWAKALAFYRDQGVSPDFVSIQNETNWFPSAKEVPRKTYNSGCQLNPTEGKGFAGYPQALAAVAKAAKEHGIDRLRFIGPDTAGIQDVEPYLSALPQGSLAAIAHHIYKGNTATSGVGRLVAMRKNHPDMPIFMTEMNPGDDLGKAQPDWMGLARTMHNHFTQEDGNGYLIWSVMWNTINPRDGKIVGTKSYQPLAHYSRFVAPGSFRAGVTSSDEQVLASLFVDPRSDAGSRRLTLVLINAGGEAREATVITSPHWASESARSWTAYLTGREGAMLHDLARIEDLAGPGLTGDRAVHLPPHSLATITINGSRK